MLSAIGPGLWTLTAPHRVMGLELGRRLTVVELSRRRLWVHASLPPTPALRSALQELGEVAAIVGPNTMHDAFLAEFVAAYPSAQFYAAPGLAQANPRLRPDALLGPERRADWETVLDGELMGGMPKLNEIVFLHRPSRTLILADLAFNLQPPKPWLTRLAMRLNGSYARLAPTRFCRTMIRDRTAFRASLQRVLAWEFDRILVGHGEEVSTGGRAALKDVFKFALT
jgi:hypothetical protein